MEYHNPTIRVLRILELIDMCPRGLSLSEIADRLGLPKGTISPILKTLAAVNYVHLDNNCYTIGLKSFELGLSFASNTDALSMIRGEMQDIVATVGEICQLGVLSDLNVFYILKENSNSPISIISEVGKKLPAHVTGLGKALLSGKSDDELRALYADYAFIPYTEHTICNLGGLLEQVRQVRSTGLAFESEESKADICCLAVPLVLDGAVRAALSVTIPIFRYDEQKRAHIAAVLLQKKKLIEDISRVQNYRFDI